MMDVLFITPMTKLALNYEVNGTLLLATKLLQAGFDVQVLRFCEAESYNKDYTAFIHEFTDKILELSPRCVSFYTLWPYYHIMLRIAAELKKRDPGIIIVLGGPQSSATAEATLRAMEQVDYICTGEGENTVVPFFTAILRDGGNALDTIPGLHYRKDGLPTFNHMEMPLCDLNTLPHWDDRLYLRHYADSGEDFTDKDYFMPIDAGRGCPYNCTFCCTSHFWRRTYRLKSPARIIEDMRYYQDRFGIRSFWFSHDAFTTNNQLVESVCDRILEEGLDVTWRCTSRIDCVTEELLLKMKQAGLTQIELGIETGSLRMQKLIKKNLKLDRAKSIIAFLLKNKIRVSLFFMYGFPEETEEDLNDTLELLFSLIDMGVSHVSMSFCKFNPLTEITEKYFDDLVIDPQIKILTRGVSFGHQEELAMIRDNKALFPFFYHLDTPVRNEYQYLFFLVHLYQQLPNSIRYLRKLYKGDNLAFYKDFYSCNRSYFEADMRQASDGVFDHPLEMLENFAACFDAPYIPQLMALARFDFNVQQVSQAQDGFSIQETYNFSYVDFKLKLPIEKYSPGKSEIMLRNVDGKLELTVLQLNFGK